MVPIHTDNMFLKAVNGIKMTNVFFLSSVLWWFEGKAHMFEYLVTS